ncbi:uncharacterized protein Z520_03543 [Fonsecaea multimorphosa CBS 102226]|uniref:R3H-associated N-terminal domain-containing protein n=1 Tax=Fonsecaea multimorphosa CBS 102226 TaxID=1442371 RepID=A0A0D2IUY3_9EURO|nr:uncharacterized protein Z520_03543 [Fonsecaea multimorphosa CBS 102226]KIY00877.1 hypothetical protein Z520_03543 [Fonsecaea multimorphosa CBS 102226]OAL27703.1 hypothetical protein AYO22_03369 [Fonsecaea multimorphosa]
MAIIPIMSAPEAAMPVVTQSTEEVTAQMDKISIEPMATPERAPVDTKAVRITVPVDATSRTAGVAKSGLYSDRKLVRRDSLERREAFLKGKEGSRQRRRWENDRLLSNPWAVPPLPSDWEVRPTYPRRTVPYYLAPLWDAAEFQRAVESKLKGRRNSTRNHGKRVVQNTGMSPMEEAATSIPKEVRAKLKRARAAKGLLQDLEETVRAFVRKWNEREIRLRRDGLHDIPLTSDSEDEEIVFIGRNGAMHDSTSKDQKDNGEAGWDDDGTIGTEKMVFEGLDKDKGAAFARWLVHCVGSYYGLRTWSVTLDVEGEEKRRQAYVGVDSRARGFLGRGVEVGREIELPRPLWGMV